MVTMIVEAIGLAGAIVILVAWAYETAKEVRQHKSLLDLRYSVMSLIGLVLLTIYSYAINVMIFFWLNIAIIAVIIFEVWYSLRIRKLHKVRG